MSRSKSVLEKVNIFVRDPSLVSFSYSKCINVLQSARKMSGASAVPISWKCLVTFYGGHIRKNMHSISGGSVFGNVNQNNFKRQLSCFSIPAYQRHPDGSDNSDKSSKKGEKGNEKLLTEQQNIKVYDPKQDSFFTRDIAYGSKENKGCGEAERPVFIPEEENSKGEEEDLLPPTTCCQSGCPNCVWIDYVEKLSKKYTDPSLSREKILKELDELEDQNIKAFIMMELRTRKLI